MSRTSGGSDTPQRNWNNLPDLLRAMPMKVSIKDGKISNKQRSERLERFGKVRIVDETNGFGLDFVKKTENYVSDTFSEFCLDLKTLNIILISGVQIVIKKIFFTTTFF